MKILKINILIILIIFITNFCFADTLELNITKQNIIKIEKQFSQKNKSFPEFESLLILEKLTKVLDSSKINKSILEQSMVIINSISIIEERYPREIEVSFPKDFLIGSNLTSVDLENASYFLNSLNKKKLINLKKSYNLATKKSYPLGELQNISFKSFKTNPALLINKIENIPRIDLVSLSLSINNNLTDITKNVSTISNEISKTNNDLNEVSNKIASATNNLSFSAGVVIAQAAANLDEAAQMLSTTISSGISIDLNSASQGMGFDSFADAVNAYNQQYGTNYTVQSAKEALGQ